MTLTVTLRQEHGDKHTLGRFRVSATTAAKPVRAPAAVVPRAEIVELIRIDPAKRDASQRERLAAYYRQIAPELYELRERPKAAQKALAAYEARLPRCLVSTSMSTPRTVRILPRGNWMDETGEVVAPALPGYLAGTPEPGDRRLTRLDLARWIVSRENPLTARVFVNRLWKQFFGIGLSKSLDDLGSQGEWPVHPELLDWLACEFMERGWDVKHMVRTIVTSQTYRQSSTASKELARPRPRQPHLARQSRFRLDAELVRDNALAISGLLVAKIGGPSVKPYQPDGYWENLNFPVRDVPGRHRGETSIAAASTPGGSGRSCTRACWPSTRPAARNARPSGPLEHPAAGAGAAERPDLRRGGPGLRRPDPRGRGRRDPGPDRLGLATGVAAPAPGRATPAISSPCSTSSGRIMPRTARPPRRCSRSGSRPARTGSTRASSRPGRTSPA